MVMIPTKHSKRLVALFFLFFNFLYKKNSNSLELKETLIMCYCGYLKLRYKSEKTTPNPL